MAFNYSFVNGTFVIPRGDYSAYWYAMGFAMVFGTLFLVLWNCCLSRFCPKDLSVSRPRSASVAVQTPGDFEKPVVGRWIFYATKRKAYEAAKEKSDGLEPFVHSPHKLGDYCHYHTANRVIEEGDTQFNHHFQFGPKYLCQGKKPKPNELGLDEVYEYSG